MKLAIAVCLILLMGGSSAQSAVDENVAYLTSTNAPKVFMRHSLDNGEGGRENLAATRSFFDPNSDTDENPTDYTTRVKPGDLFALDSLKVRVGNEWLRVMSDSDNEENGPADGFEDGFGDAGSLYDMAMAVIAFTHAGRFEEARTILNGFQRTAQVMFDDGATAAAHPGGSVRDQAENFPFFPASIIAPSFDIWIEQDTNAVFDPNIDIRRSGYPRLSPGHEYGIWYNQPENPAWAGVDDLTDVPRVSEFRDDFDSDENYSFLPYYEANWHHRLFVPYSLFFQWHNVDTPVHEGTETAERIAVDRIISYSTNFTKEYRLRDYSISVGDNLWLAIAALQYAAVTRDTNYLEIAYKIMDTVVDNLQDFNGGIHFGYYGSHEITPTSTEHNLDFAFAWNWIDKLHQEGLVDQGHHERYRVAMEGTIDLGTNTIMVVDVEDRTSDDIAVAGAKLMLRFLGIRHASLSCRLNAVDLAIPPDCKVLLLPETPLAESESLKQKVGAFFAAGGAIFGTGASALNIGAANNPFGVSFSAMQGISGIGGNVRNIVVTKVYKDGVDSPAFAIDSNLSSALELATTNAFVKGKDVPEPPEIDNWEEGLGNLLYAFAAQTPYNHLLLWSHSDYKRSRLTYFLSDIGDDFHALNGGKTPDLDNANSAEDLALLRTQNEGTVITCERMAVNPTVLTANDHGNLSICLAKIAPGSPTNGVYQYTRNNEETLFFNQIKGEVSEGKAVYFAGDMFSFFYKAMNRLPAGGNLLSPFKPAVAQAYQSHAQILENGLQWLLTSNLEPVYTVRQPYGSAAVYLNNAKEEMGHLGASNVFGESGGTTLMVDLRYVEPNVPATNKMIRIEKFAGESFAGVWLTKSIDFGTNSSMSAGRVNGAFVGANLSGTTKLTFEARADSPLNVEFGIGIDADGNPVQINHEIEDSAHWSINVSVGTEWNTYSIDISGLDLSHINGLFFVRVLSEQGVLFIDNIRYNPGLFGYNQEFGNQDTVIYREGYGNEGIWSGFFGFYQGSSLTIDRRCQENPHSGQFCIKVSKNLIPPGFSESFAGIFVQQKGTDPNESVRWSGGPGIGANLRGCTSLVFSVRANRVTGLEVGLGYFSDSAKLKTNIVVDTTWRNFVLDVSQANLENINGLFYFTATNRTVTLFFDDIDFLPSGSLPRTYQQDVDEGQHSPYLWRDKGLVHLGVRHFLENTVWGDSDDFLRLPPGCYETSRDTDGDGKPQDFVYENPDANIPWPNPNQWIRKKFFLRGQLDFVKAADLTTWGAAYWLDKPIPNPANATALLALSDELFLTTVSRGGTNVTSMEYWDLPSNDLVNVGDDFGECVWPEGVGQLIQAAYLLGNSALAKRHINEMQKIEYDFGNGKKAYPYAWPRNMITDIGGPGDGDDQERLTSLSVAATAWMFLGKNQLSTFAYAKVPLLIINIFRTGDTSVKLEWTSVAGRNYTVLKSTTVDGQFTPLALDIVATGRVTSFVDSSAQGQGFYMIRAVQ